MRDRTKVFSFALCALLMLGFASAAQAQVLWNTTFTNNQVVHYGLTEVMGEVRFTSVSGTTQGSTITVTYLGAAITNTLSANTPIDTAAGGGTVTSALGLASPGGVFSAAAGVTWTAINTGLGGQITISLPAGIGVTAGGGDQIRINGVRTDVSPLTVGTTIQAQTSSSPSSANSFNFQQGLVATVNESLTITTTGVVDAICISSTGTPRITLTEGFSGVFYDNAPTLLPRVPYGANGPTQIKLTVTGLPAGVSLSWPSLVVDSSGGRYPTTPVTPLKPGTLVRG